METLRMRGTVTGSCSITRIRMGFVDEMMKRSHAGHCDALPCYHHGDNDAMVSLYSTRHCLRLL